MALGYLNTLDNSFQSLDGVRVQPDAYFVDIDIENFDSQEGKKLPVGLFLAGGSRIYYTWDNWPAKKQSLSR
jgi:hypothetical protein